MNALVLDTSTFRAAIGLRPRSGIVYVKATDGMQKHGRDLIPSVAEVLARAAALPRARSRQSASVWGRVRTPVYGSA